MDNTAIIKCADHILQQHAPGATFHINDITQALKKEGLCRNGSEMLVVLQHMERHGFCAEQQERGFYRMIRSGLLSNHLQQLHAESELDSQVKRATIEAAEAASSSARSARKANNIAIWAIIISVLSMALAIYSVVQDKL